jgi:hypothetical protein
MPTPEELAKQTEESEVLEALWDILGTPSSSQEDPTDDKLPTNPIKNDGNEVEKLKVENEQLKKENQDKEIIASKAISKKNKWKEKFMQASERLNQLQAWELDDSFDSERDRDMAIVATQSETTLARSQMEEAEAEERDSFYTENPFARENLNSIEELAEKHSLDTESAYKLFLANNHPEKLYDVHKARQKDWGFSMIKNGGSPRAWSIVEDMPLEELEKTLIESHKQGNWSL